MRVNFGGAVVGNSMIRLLAHILLFIINQHSSFTRWWVQLPKPTRCLEGGRKRQVFASHLERPKEEGEHSIGNSCKQPQCQQESSLGPLPWEKYQVVLQAELQVASITKVSLQLPNYKTTPPSSTACHHFKLLHDNAIEGKAQ